MSSLWGIKRPEITFLFHWLVRLRERLMNGVAVAEDGGFGIHAC